MNLKSKNFLIISTGGSTIIDASINHYLHSLLQMLQFMDTRMQAFLLHLVFGSFVFFSSIRDGYARITSSFVRSEFPSVDIPLNHEAFAVPKGYNAPQQVSLTKTIIFYFVFVIKTDYISA
jgi:hypothetical protein